MGTRADFYVQAPTGLEWLGSIAWDGYPDGIDAPVMAAKSADEFRAALTYFFAKRDDVTLPEQGWPWPWNTSDTTDYGYVLIEGRGVFYSGFGGEFYAADSEPDEDGEHMPAADVAFEYPDMADRKNVARGSDRSGVMIFSA
jgi:hypothetical protein